MITLIALTFDQMALAQFAYLIVGAVQGLITFGLWRFGAHQYRRLHVLRGGIALVVTVLAGLFTLNTLVAAARTLQRGGFLAASGASPGDQMITTGVGYEIGYQIGNVLAIGIFLGIPIGLVYLCGRASSWQQKVGHQRRSAVLSILTVILAIVCVGVGMAILHL